MKQILVCIFLLALALVAAEDTQANGREVQREVVGRVVAVHAHEGTVEVEREFRGKVWRLTLRVPEGTVIFACEQTAATLAELRPGDQVSIYYEQVGREGLANLVVIEPRE
ncbi:MAG TPA: TOBE domain-containing protein [Alphaproteobacteria bacterium]|nr:TOBE domain-containing protein [Alphaproteobacteria bacterium]